ncbi:hypothetical protein KIN20_023919 [Parelaphostrongylus tenuis]|uniref:Uncharacterized protein n=1 Tax=Parelaphostrongylus tenuis TaxID=148309 RepID=A0AAD5MWD0_PARTN|nr:hypothetical protein KIN20_023919 [Parelaphostrongylus tenuis]
MPRSGQPIVLDEGDLKAVLDAKPTSSVRGLAEKLIVSQRTLVNKFHQFGLVHRKKKKIARKSWTMVVYTSKNNYCFAVNLRNKM